MNKTFSHTSVLLHETVDALNLKEVIKNHSQSNVFSVHPKNDAEKTSSEIVLVDGTLGGGGHSALIAEQLTTIFASNFDHTTEPKPKAHIIGFDLDEDAEKRAHEKLSKFLSKNLHSTKENGLDHPNSSTVINFTFINENFRTMKEALNKRGIETVDGVILDLGISSFQLEASERGFSFMRDEDLLMTFGQKGTSAAHKANAKEIVNTWSEETLANIIYGYGEDIKARKIAKAIVDARKVASLETTGDLVRAIESAVGKKPFWLKFKKGGGNIHPATRTFQALRIAVNDELEALKQGLKEAFELLKPGARLAVISFHSLEDRIVKEQFKAWASLKDDSPSTHESEFVVDEYHALKGTTGKRTDSTSADEEMKGKSGTLITKKPIIPGDEEIMENSRSRSAKLRIIEKN